MYKLRTVNIFVPEPKLAWQRQFSLTRQFFVSAYLRPEGRWEDERQLTKFRFTQLGNILSEVRRSATNCTFRHFYVVTGRDKRKARLRVTELIRDHQISRVQNRYTENLNETFLNGEQIFLYMFGPQQLKPRTVVKRALAQVGQVGVYNAQTNNCEHFSCRAKTGYSASVQSDPPRNYALPRARQLTRRRK
jgi:hypothetical protein